MTVTILPPNATATELAVEAATDRPIPVEIATLWNPDLCPETHLPWLAEALSVDEWDTDWPIETRREVIRSSVEVHRRKGTVGSVRRALRAAGYGEVVIVERYGWNDHDGQRLHDGSITYDIRDHWAEYRLTVARPLTLAQSQRLVDLLAVVAPARSRLKALNFLEVPNIYNAAITYAGAHKHGVP